MVDLSNIFETICPDETEDELVLDILLEETDLRPVVYSMECE